MTTTQHSAADGAPTVVDPLGGPTYPIASVDSALKLMHLLAKRRRLRIADASKELGVARSTAHRLIQMLQLHGFAQQDPESRAYEAGPALLNLGLQAVRQLDIRRAARPTLARLVDDVTETAHLMSIQDAEMVCLDSIESPQVLRVSARVGMVIPTHGSAAGRAVLAASSRERVREIYPHRALPSLESSTVRTRARLEEVLETVRVAGYAVQHGETEPGVSAVAAAVVRGDGDPRFAVTIGIPTTRLKDDQIPVLGEAARRAASEIGELLA